MIKIYHNPRCSKSREGLKILETSNKTFKVIKYLDDKLSLQDLEEIIDLLNIEPIDLVRKNEIIWKTQFKNKQLSKPQLLQILLEYPKLIERPIVINGKKAVIGRPPEAILDII